MKPLRLLFVFGTRPEAIKMAPLIRELEKHPDELDVRICVTGQHREMLQQVLALFEIEPNLDLEIMRPNQSLSGITSSVLNRLGSVIENESPDWVVVQGDTTTSFAAALVAFYAHVPVAHVEAGLRSGNRFAPWPEEMNRSLTTVIAELHFAPTTRSRQNLLDCNVPDRIIHVTGNTVIDALFAVVEKLRADESLRAGVAARFPGLSADRRLILVTGHRRENFGEGFDAICHALADLVERNRDVEVLYPVHLNPNVREPVERILGSHPDTRDRIHLIDPVDYLSIVHLMDRAYLILTDSGGIQEEAPSLGKPVLVMRETTERPEAVDAGTVRLVGTGREKIVEEAEWLLNDPAHYEEMSRAHNPYGDGLASQRIAEVFRGLRTGP